jgi:hypothetical protein
MNAQEQRCNKRDWAGESAPQYYCKHRLNVMPLTTTADQLSGGWLCGFVCKVLLPNFPPNNPPFLNQSLI